MQEAILITGAGQRIGLYLAEQFLEQGQPVVFTYRQYRPSVDVLKSKGALGFQVDFNDTDSLDAFLKALPRQVQSLRAVIHNASIWVTDSQIAEVPTLLEDLLRVHVSAPYQINMACYPLLCASQAQSSDVIALSDARVSTGHSEYSGYLASKSALETMTKSLAKAWAPKVKLNVLAPGLVIFNDRDTEIQRAARLAESAIPQQIGLEGIWQSVQYLLNSQTSTATRLELGQCLNH
ncbi:dihydromonapterin reductase [Hydrogenovibrio sp. SC-1]|uniref:dihydromonapterin reductase n=1 Tax=Hydrogenovibrio sp. SC-1 TaxID=2065820 RepID=UPI001E282BC1|nr:dihydromonapterin reductase [Hydrogenovibrio sp. SC-1]